MAHVAVLEVDALRAMVREAVRAEVAGLRGDEREVMTREQVAEYLQVCVETVTTRVERDGLPGVKLPGSREWRFLRSDVQAWVRGQAAKEKR